MSEMMKFLSIVIMAAVFLVAIAPETKAQIGCGTVVSDLRPCIPYLTSNAPLGGCCGGVKALNAAAKTPADRKSVCGCLKSLAGSYPGAAVSKAAGLPGTCGVSVPFKISPSTDCSKVQ